MEHLKTLIKQSGFTQSDIAKSIGVSQSQVSQACNGENNKIEKKILEAYASDFVIYKELVSIQKKMFDNIFRRDDIALGCSSIFWSLFLLYFLF